MATKQQVVNWLRRNGPSVLLCGIPVLFGAAIVALIAPAISPRQSQIDPKLLDALLEEPKQQEIIQNKKIIDNKNRYKHDDLAIPNAGRLTPSLEIRVMLQESENSAQISAEGPWSLQLRNGDIWREGKGIIPINCSKDNLNVADQKAPIELWLRPTRGGNVEYNGINYRGELRFLCMGDQLAIINHISLEDYIASVVGAEMPSYWPDEALRAQAVAARSYALAHLARPGDSNWNLGATTRWQAYQGMASESGPSRSATEFTKGLVLSYKGGIVESLYAADKLITFEAHGHLGASMSQQGARELAQRGYKFSQILSKYYRGAKLARLRRSA